MRKVYIFLALIIIALIIITLPIELPTEDDATDYRQPNTNLSEQYQEHPKTIKDCENTSSKDFCIGDVAEITNNINLCYEISDNEVRGFCVARISLNKTMCMELDSKDFREACLESISLKESWS